MHTRLTLPLGLLALAEAVRATPLLPNGLLPNAADAPLPTALPLSLPDLAIPTLSLPLPSLSIPGTDSLASALSGALIPPTSTPMSVPAVVAPSSPPSTVYAPSWNEGHKQEELGAVMVEQEHEPEGLEEAMRKLILAAFGSIPSKLGLHFDTPEGTATPQEVMAAPAAAYPSPTEGEAQFGFAPSGGKGASGGQGWQGGGGSGGSGYSVGGGYGGRGDEQGGKGPGDNSNPPPGWSPPAQSAGSYAPASPPPSSDAHASQAAWSPPSAQAAPYGAAAPASVAAAPSAATGSTKSSPGLYLPHVNIPGITGDIHSGLCIKDDRGNFIGWCGDHPGLLPSVQDQESFGIHV